MHDAGRHGDASRGPRTDRARRLRLGSKTRGEFRVTGLCNLAGRYTHDAEGVTYTAGPFITFQ